jgi:hypothetical protein
MLIIFTADKAGAYSTNRIASSRKRSQRSNRENAVTLHRVSVVHIKSMNFI